MSVPSLESLIAQHRYVSDMVSPTRDCTCGYASGIGSPAEHAAHVAEVIRQHGLDRTSGLNAAADVVHAEARYQWEMDARRAVCAQVVAQRMGVVERTIRSFVDGAEDHQ
ncbi:hypothetical protein SEA_GETALONG_89 [Gordonia phage Getalong]|uniref:Uncharacterized protein n=4 Tax=Getalongvirus TaxID=2733156 RepID=A0A3S9UPZ4_9CAUD|nr:hypothetical protein HOS44_gp086 [Gordonia phage BENtherdunthat]YP_009814202.1 hypothetical protein HOU38_gp089 [Gordonia phage Getalong]YP_009818697.1 hypothetical protein HOU97_gp81 [Gordonia phage Kenna]QCG77244.1 hypothetical protein SEA_LUTUM_87 [Gordonia phage Lutum]USH45588.1 hypothetical protein SEA_PHABULOSO_93 [Gordonia phage Phabuloso]ATW60856.1 hypothetical protein SEA_BENTHERDUNTHAT_86 [Gordonia phage BENtherdunthat]AYD83949.1 hypothetical protein SEA_GETALONG_89 [Gordonia pha